MIFQLVYSSVATKEFWPDDLFVLVEKSRRKNFDRDITGMLLYHQGKFLQLLEGPEAAVRGCYARVERDPRHHSTRVLLTQTSEHRDFPNWTMGYEKVEEAWNVPRAWATILEEGFDSVAVSQNPSVAKDFLSSFQHGLTVAADGAPSSPKAHRAE